MNSDLITQRNKYDKTGECVQSGIGAEQIFDQIAESKNLEVKNARRRENIHKHIDKYVTSENDKRVETWSVDIKARKKTSRSDSNAQDEWIWIEFQNVRGNLGWLYGEADNIAFETQDGFVIVDRKSFLAKYKTYQRAGRNDLLTMVELSKIIENCNHFVWQK